MLFEPDEQPEITSPYPGKDEMNFAEFPIALLTDRVPKGQKNIKFEDKIYDEKRKKVIVRRRIIEGSEEYGLPTATDDAVVLGLIQLTKQRSDFTRPELEFSRLELIKLLGWPNEGKSYDRIKLSLQRIANVTYNYDNAWWDSRQKKWTTKIFHILETVEINDSRASNGQGGLFPSRIVWNEVVFSSFQSGFLRDIDFQLCMRLEHPTAMRMYRFLGKRFYVKPDWTFDLKEFAYEHIGLGRNYEGGTQIARKLQPAILELEGAGFLEPLGEDERYIKKGREWSIRFLQRTPAPLLPSPPQTEPEPAPPEPLVAELTRRGMTEGAAIKLVKQYPAERIAAKIEHFDWEMMQPTPPRRPAGYLRTSIIENYAPSAGFIPKVERQAAEEAKQAKEREAAEKRRYKQVAETRRQEEQAAADAYWAALTPDQQRQLEADALADGGEEARQTYETMKGIRGGSGYLKILCRDYISRMMREGKFAPVEA